VKLPSPELKFTPKQTTNPGTILRPNILVKWPKDDNATIDPLSVLTQENQRYYLKPAVRSFFLDKRSLTLRLNKLYGAPIQAKVLGNHLSALSPHWRALMGLSSLQPWHTRTAVLLPPKGKPAIIAQTIIPQKPLHQLGYQLQHCGHTPIGHLLFSSNYQPNREWLFSGKVPIQALPQSTRQVLTSCSRKPLMKVWARQSLIFTEPTPIAITEFFLPTVWDYLAKILLSDKG